MQYVYAVKVHQESFTNGIPKALIVVMLDSTVMQICPRPNYHGTSLWQNFTLQFVLL